MKTKQEKLEDYIVGFKEGALGNVDMAFWRKNKRNKEYNDGIRDGTTAYRNATAAFMEKIGYRLTTEIND